MFFHPERRKPKKCAGRAVGARPKRSFDRDVRPSTQPDVAGALVRGGVSSKHRRTAKGHFIREALNASGTRNAC
jgi:hypothetical protein